MTEARVGSSQRKGQERPPATATNAETQTLNFKVTPQFKREFKGYAVSQGMTMLESLKQGFELSKRKQQ